MSTIISITKPKLTDQITLIDVMMQNLNNPIKNVDDIDNILLLDETECITKVEMNINIIETNIKLLHINEDEPYKDSLYEDILRNICNIFNNFDKLRILYNEYNDFPISEIHILKDVKKINDTEFNDMVTTQLNNKKDRDFKNCLRGINIYRIELIKSLVFIKEIVNKIIKREPYICFDSDI